MVAKYDDALINAYLGLNKLMIKRMSFNAFAASLIVIFKVKDS